MKLSADDEAHLVQLATRIPRRIARSLKEHCVRHDIRMQSFVRTALVEQLDRVRSRTPRRG